MADDFLIHLEGRQADEAGGEVGEQALEREPLAQQRIRTGRCLSVVQRPPPQGCVSHLRGQIEWTLVV